MDDPRLVRRGRNPLPQLVPARVRRAKERVDAGLWTAWRELRVTAGPLNERPVDLATAKQQTFSPVRPGEHFGPRGGGWQQRWFAVEVPLLPAGQVFHLHWRCQGEATAYVGDQPWAGLDHQHRTMRVPSDTRAVWIDCGTYATGIAPSQAEPIGAYGLRFDGARLAKRDDLAWKVSWDLDVFLQLVRTLLADGGHAISDANYGYQAPLERASPLLRLLLGALDEACDAYDREGLSALSDALDALFDRLPAESWQPIAAVCPQTHIDLVWLWPEREAERKAVHSLATVMRLFEQYPELTFTGSQPAMYRAVERLAPALAEQIAGHVRSGRWEVLGGFEVEPDTQLPCGEALARCLVIGQRRVAELRGGAMDSVCWLPDVFGYSACLPQLLSLAGITRFFTTKLRWSAVTRFPYQSFVWRGADGSEVLAQISTIGYTGVCEVAPLVAAAREYTQADVSPEMLLAQGLGDGGGGPTEGMCERVRRLRNLAGVPRVQYTRAEDFFTRLERVRDRLPVYQGELYLEYHRGTYTTQGELKRLYRCAETALQAWEAVRVVTGRGPIDEAPWRRLCFAQFHDALPGSSIGLVYDEICPELQALADKALAAATKELGAGAVAWNPLPVPRRVVLDEGGTQRALLLPALGGAPLAESDGGSVCHASATELGSDRVHVTFANGAPTTITIDGAPLALSGPVQLRLYPDHPAKFGAWDIDHAALGQGFVLAPESLALVSVGPLRAVLRGQVSLGQGSRAELDWIVEAGVPWLRAELRVDWRAAHRLLKLHVPTRHRGRFARFGTPFGSVLRPQQRGDVAAEAMWEVPGSRWAAVLDDDGSGLAIVTEAKYGFSCQDGDLGLSLLRAPDDPDPNADRGHHVIRLAIGRHRPDTAGLELATAAAADALFAPVLRVAAAPRPPITPETLGTLVPQWVLPATGGGFILRAHETAGARGTATFLVDASEATLMDLLERPVPGPCRVEQGRVSVDYEPYQVLSVRLRR